MEKKGEREGKERKGAKKKGGDGGSEGRMGP